MIESNPWYDGDLATGGRQYRYGARGRELPCDLADNNDDSVFQREGLNSLGSPQWSSSTYTLTGPMFSVQRMSGKAGKLLERVRYRPYGEARHQWGATYGDGRGTRLYVRIAITRWTLDDGDCGTVSSVDADLQIGTGIVELGSYRFRGA